ncbi:unnamed protein product [Ambrosiozyma monospora]|uniref:Unnamed protein product n=1 Tax=Ambrosiozyma monospora TaxID=43982 RepID=A0A9W6Z0M7_AMBMO|nr:unnamed protein product [Ambrosiozyma monospora]
MQRLMIIDNDDNNTTTTTQDQNEETVPPPYMQSSASNEDDLVALRREVFSLRATNRKINMLLKFHQLESMSQEQHVRTTSMGPEIDSMSPQLIAAFSQGLPVLDEILMFGRYWGQLSGTFTILGYTQCIQFVNEDILYQPLDNEKEEKFVCGLLQSTLNPKFSRDLMLALQSPKIGSACVATLSSLKHQYELAKAEFISDVRLRMENSRLKMSSRGNKGLEDAPFFVNFKKWLNQLKDYQLEDEISESQVMEYAYAGVRQTKGYTAWAKKYEKDRGVDSFDAYKLFGDIDELAGAVHHVMSTTDVCLLVFFCVFPFVILFYFDALLMIKMSS